MNTEEFRQLIEDTRLSQRGAARAIDIDERTMRRYCSEKDMLKAPIAVQLALKHISREQLIKEGFETVQDSGHIRLVPLDKEVLDDALKAIAGKSDE